jgi:hypothetical protein
MSSQDGIPSSRSTVADRALEKLTETHCISLLAAAGPFNGRVADGPGLANLPSSMPHMRITIKP